MAKSNSSVSNREKIAVLMVALGNDIAAEVYKKLDDTAIELITLEVANLRKVTPELKLEVLKEAQEILMAREFMARGGVDYARDVLERALGPESVNVTSDGDDVTITVADTGKGIPKENLAHVCREIGRASCRERV